MTITAIDPNATYQLSGADFLAAIANAVKSTIAELGIDSSNANDKWKGKKEFNADEAAEFLGVKKATLYVFNAKYDINRTGRRPMFYTLEELQRVKNERSLRPL